MSSEYNLAAPRRIIASNLPLPGSLAKDDSSAEPGVEVLVDTLAQEPILGGTIMKSRVTTSKTVPSSNDGHGNIPLDDVPGIGIVLPGGLNMYYIDLAPNTEGTMHRTTSTDYLVILQGELTLLTPGTQPYTVKDGKSTYGEPVATTAKEGEVVLQRGMMHALSNRTDTWVRLLAVVVSSKPNQVPVTVGTTSSDDEDGGAKKELPDMWLP